MMQTPSAQAPLNGHDAYAFGTFHSETDKSWFPVHPDCPNHKAGVPFSSAYAEPNSSGQVSCTECFFHSTIMQNMALPLSCHHLHACASCANCYSHNNGQSPTSIGPGISPPLFPCNSPIGAGVSPPLFRGRSPQVSPYDPEAYKPPASAYRNESESLNEQRRASLPIQLAFPRSGQQQVHSNQSYSSPPTPYQLALSNDSYNHIAANQQANSIQQAIVKRFTSQPYSDSAPATPTSEDRTVLDLGFKCSVSLDVTKKTKQVMSEIKPENTNRKRSANDVCEVCGDRASGYHYNALTCEGCKGFFRRSINKKDAPYKCKYGGNCEMDTYTRRKCPDCRLRKCKAVGMLEECLLTEIQCRSKRRSRKPKQAPRIEKQTSEPSSSSTSQPVKSTSSNNLKQGSAKQVDQKSHSSEEEKLIGHVGNAFTEYRSNPEIVKRWTSYLEKSNSHPNLCEVATVHVKILVEFTKKLPGFTRMGAEDQIALLKGSVVEMMLLRNSCGYNMKKGELDVSMVVKDTGIHETHFKALMDFFARIENINLDQTEYGLLCAIILFDSDHSHTQDTARIERYRDMYLSALTHYSERKMPKRTHIVAKILALVTELRTLYHTHAQMVSNMREKEQLTPLLCEIWDLG